MVVVPRLSWFCSAGQPCDSHRVLNEIPNTLLLVTCQKSKPCAITVYNTLGG